MEITYIGHACFKIKGKTGSLVIDPYSPEETGYKLSKLSSDILLITHDHHDHNYAEGVSDYSILIDSPGEYESKGIYIEGFSTFHDNKGGVERGNNTIYQINIDGFNVLHMGDIGHELSKETVEKLASIDVLLVPVGGVYTIGAKVAPKVISSIEPGIVIPMHYGGKELDPLKKFLDEMGDENVKKVEKLKLANRSEIPDEMEIIELTPTY